MNLARAGALMLLVFSAGCPSEHPDDSGASIRTAEPVEHEWASAEVVESWTSAGARVGIMEPLADNALAFPLFQDVSPQPEQLPAFAVDGAIDLSSVSDPGVPFGLMWSGATSEQLEHLAHLENLQVLELMIEDLSAANLEQLASLSHLRSLSIYHTGFGLSEAEAIDAGMTHLAGLTHLERLKLTSINVDAGLQALAGLEHLVTLDLYGAKVTDVGVEAVGQLQRLTGLDLSGTAVSDAGIAHLSGLSQLTLLKLDRTPATADGVMQLQQALPNCTISHTE